MTDSGKKPDNNQDNRPEAFSSTVTSFGVAVRITARISPPGDKRPHLFQIRIARAGLPQLTSKIEIPVSSGDCAELGQMFDSIANRIKGYEGRQG